MKITIENWHFLDIFVVLTLLYTIKIEKKCFTKNSYQTFDIFKCRRSGFFFFHIFGNSDSITLHYSSKPVETVILTLLVNKDRLRMFSNSGPWNRIVKFCHHFTIFQ